MANQENFRTNIDALTDEYNRFSVSRIVQSPTDDLVEMEMPVDFQDDLLNTNVEVAIYTIGDNTPVFLTSIKSSENEVITAKRLQYTDDSFRTLLFIDFSKIQNFVDFPIGQFSVTLSFFIDELGSFDDKVLKLTRISPSRKEVQFEIQDSSKLSQMIDLASPRITSNWIMDSIKQIFNQAGSSLSDIPASSVAVTSQSISTEFTQSLNEDLIKYSFNVDISNQKGVYTVAQEILDRAYLIVKTEIENDLENNKTFFTNEQLKQKVNSAISTVYQDVKTQQYRFTLL